MKREIHLVRHGRSSHPYNGEWLDGPQLYRYVEAYDAAGIAADSHPNEKLTSIVGRTTRVMSSDMRRAVESAQRVAAGRPIETTPLLKEVPSPWREWPVPMPMIAWDVAVQTSWFFRSMLRMDDADGITQRAVLAADWLLARANPVEPLVVITHGDFRSVLGDQLQRHGFAFTAGRGDFKNWSVWSYVEAS